MKTITRPELREMLDDEANWAKVEAWLGRGDSAAVYENKAFDSHDFGRKFFLSFGSEAAQVPETEPPEKMPDLGLVSTPWAYCLEATCAGG